MRESFLFYDLETFGGDPRRSRIAQFAAVRTDTALNPIDAPISFFVRPANDLLPSPIATLITGISPQHAQHQGEIESNAASRIVEALGQPRTCTLGYNSLRFDDEFIRYTLYRNFFDPYEREWRNGNSRWDLLDVLRLAHALRPDGIAWPRRDDGFTSFKLEHLAAINGVRCGDAHEALSDVHATLGMARLLKTHQPRLWDYALRLRDKRYTASLLDTILMQPVLHVSQRYPASRLCAAPVVPLIQHPTIGNRVIVFDLNGAIDPLLTLTSDAIADRLYTPVVELPRGEQRIALKEVQLNRSPMLVPWAYLRPADFQRLAINSDEIVAKARMLKTKGPELAEKMRRVFTLQRGDAIQDVDAALYEGFLDDHDRTLITRARHTPSAELIANDFSFHDRRLPDLLFRYRARNWPESLNNDEYERWNAYRRHRLNTDNGLSELTFSQFFTEIASLRRQSPQAGRHHGLLDQLEIWGRQLQDELS